MSLSTAHQPARRPTARHDWPGGALLGSLLLHGGALAVGLGLLAAATPPQLLQGAAEPAVYEVVLTGAAEIAAESPAAESPAAESPAAEPVEVAIAAPPVPEPAPEPVAEPVVEPVAEPVVEPVPPPPEPVIPEPAPVVAAVEPAPPPEPAPEPVAEPVVEPPPPTLAPEPPPVPAPVQQPPVKPAVAQAKPRPPRPAGPVGTASGGRTAPVAASVVASAPGPAAEAASHSAQALRQPPPLYPPAARRRGLEGVVLLRVRVGPSGAVEAVEVASSSGASLLDDAARDAVRNWTFRPAMRLGVAVAAVVDAPVRFRLNDP